MSGGGRAAVIGATYNGLSVFVLVYVYKCMSPGSIQNSVNCEKFSKRNVANDTVEKGGRKACWTNNLENSKNVYGLLVIPPKYSSSRYASSIFSHTAHLSVEGILTFSSHVSLCESMSGILPLLQSSIICSYDRSFVARMQIDHQIHLGASSSSDRSLHPATKLKT